MDKSFWKETVGKNANQKSVGSYNRNEGGVCAKKGKGISAVKRRKRGSEGVC